ncbi:carbonic anhydrase [Clostridium sp. UBA7503]|uniref:beta-class carbonic anhydrase n=1 Tax=Clostridium sp. UBA7503 TaxID=1946377 RepID=UPI0032174C44
MIDEILKYNKEFVENKEYERYITSKYPDKKIAIVTCMDTRLTELLPAALGFKNGDVKIIKNAGGSISHPFGSVARSLLVAIYDLGVEEIFVIGHTDCGAQHMNSKKIIEKMKLRNITEDQINLAKYFGVNFDSWLSGFDNVNTSVAETVAIITKHPLIPKDINVYGFIMDSTTGELTPV